MSLRIVLAGNPNAGKTSLFNEITGAMQKVGNWGGVTVEIKKGTTIVDGQKISLTDLPGTYSLNACSEEEVVARNFIIQEKPDVIIDVIDATNLSRHLYLTVQLLGMGIKPIIALNMWDEVKTQKIDINIKRLESLLGCTIVATSARNGKGIKELMEKAVAQSKTEAKNELLHVKLPIELEQCVSELEAELKKSVSIEYPPRWIAIKLFEHDAEMEKLIFHDKIHEEMKNRRDLCEDKIIGVLGDDAPTLIAESRYGFIAGIVKETVDERKENRNEISYKVDSILTHRVFAYPIFLVFMWLLFQMTFKLGEYPMALIEMLFEFLQNSARSFLPEGIMRNLMVDGVIAGVGGVIVFLPNILILFFGISIMEDTGYMARTAFIMDKLMHKIGLHGKSFIPMIMGLGCTVPAIMATRTLESKSDRIKTILLAPLISCSARLPVFVLFAGAFFPKHAGNVVFLFQIIFSFGAFIVMALVFKYTLFKNAEEYPFVMELPPYRIPTGRSILIHMWQRAQHYIEKMGTVVLFFSVVLWWAGAYPILPDISEKYDKEILIVKTSANISEDAMALQISKIKTEKQSVLMENRYIGRIGKIFEPIVRPFGSDWRGAVSLVTGFIAKEVVVSSMGVLYAITDEPDKKGGMLREKLKEHYTQLSAFAFMLFVLLYTPCIVALITAIRELKNWQWSLFSVVYQLIFAWSVATIVFQGGKILGLS